MESDIRDFMSRQPGAGCRYGSAELQVLGQWREGKGHKQEGDYEEINRLYTEFHKVAGDPQETGRAPDRLTDARHRRIRVSKRKSAIPSV